MSDSEKQSASGSPIYRHKGPVSEEIVTHATPFLKEIGEHIERHIGPVPTVFHELVSPNAHIDLYIVSPTPARNYYTVVTAGMSSQPMKVPPGAEHLRFAEVLIVLPSNWPGMKPDGTFDREVMKDERYWWPFRWIKTLARLPHQYQTWLGPGHTVPNGDPAKPFADNTKLCCMMVFIPLSLPQEALQLRVGDDVIHFYAAWPLYLEEMKLKMDKGLNALIDKFEKAGTRELIDPVRPNSCVKKSFWRS